MWDPAVEAVRHDAVTLDGEHEAHRIVEAIAT